MFQLTRPRGARLGRGFFHVNRFQFQLTRPRGARPHYPRQGNLNGMFQLTRPRGARLGLSMRHAHCASFQLTRPRGARPITVSMTAVLRPVSTHAPARGATSTSMRRTTRGRVSTHAPARGATSVSFDEVDGVRFQLTRPRGARLAGRDDAVRRAGVSTHAPARGATEVRVHPRGGVFSFNSRAREGRDVSKM